MTRRAAQFPKVNPGEYIRWRKNFEGGPFVRRLLAKLEPAEAEQIRTVLFAAQLGPWQLTREQVKTTWPKKGLTTRINVIDYAIMFLVARLEKKTQRINEDTAALLTAAGVPAGRPSIWSAETVKKRRKRAKLHTWASIVSPRFVLRRLFADLLKARQRDSSANP